MKRRILAIILAAVLLFLSACAPANAFVGSWTLTERTVDGAPKDLSQMSVKYTFENDGTFTMIVNGMEAAAGTYTIQNDVIIWLVNDMSGYMTLRDGKLVAETTVNGKPDISTYERN